MIKLIPPFEAVSPFARRRWWWTRWLDRWAAKRVLRAMIGKTDNMLSVRWLGQLIWQCPLDAWVIQEVIGALQPDVIVETGTFLGGSAYYYAGLCELLGHGQVISIDISPKGTIAHPRITYIQGSSVDPAIVAPVRAAMGRADRVLVILDSDHSERHVLAELEAYALGVPIGSYILIQDACIDTFDIFKVARPGPTGAIRQFMAAHPQFVRDRELEERYVMTVHPGGWWRRVS
jgi:cephalosporin hydroxylase